jgi:hypothetical protein
VPSNFLFADHPPTIPYTTVATGGANAAKMSDQIEGCTPTHPSRRPAFASSRRQPGKNLNRPFVVQWGYTLPHPPRAEYGDDTGNGRVGREKLALPQIRRPVNDQRHGFLRLFPVEAGTRKRLPSGLTSKPAAPKEGKSKEA